MTAPFTPLWPTRAWHWLRAAWHALTLDDRTAYLASATDLPDLERRMRAWERGAVGGPARF